MEVEVASENLVGSLSGEDHLDAHRLDVAGHEVHRGGGPDGGYVIGLDVVDDVPQGIDAFLHGEVDLVVDGADVVSDLLCLLEIRSPLEADGEGVELRPPCAGLAAFLDSAVSELLGDSGDDGGVKAA